MKFKIGDWVRSKAFENDGNEELLIKKLKVQQQVDFVHKYQEEWELWQPKEGEWCWYKDNLVRITNINEYGYIRAETATRMKQFDFESFKECEPFIGNLPSFIKEIK